MEACVTKDGIILTETQVIAMERKQEKREAFGEIETEHTIPSAKVLNDRVLQFFEEQEIPLLRILTDRGTEYNGKPEHHEYELYLQIEGIEHSKTKVRHPQSNGICERLLRTMQEKFYAVAFRKKPYNSLEELQRDLDQWLKYYNHERTHIGRYCYGKTQMEAFKESLILARQKIIGQVTLAA